ncbi:MAG: hypothetical protein WCO56_09545 [Verrucomicrobiota bacterium]
MIASWFNNVPFGVAMLITVVFGVLLVREGWSELTEDEPSQVSAPESHALQRHWWPHEAIMAATAFTLALVIVSLR